MPVQLTEGRLEPWQALAAFEANRVGGRSDAGATAAFVGTMRDFNEGDPVHAMFLEHYPGMTERTLERVCREAAATHGLIDTLVIHRIGHVVPGDAIVLVAAWATHRKTAFEGCREIMEFLKQQAPFWKKEQLAEGERWVEANTPGY